MTKQEKLMYLKWCYKQEKKYIKSLKKAGWIKGKKYWKNKLKKLKK